MRQEHSSSNATLDRLNRIADALGLQPEGRVASPLWKLRMFNGGRAMSVPDRQDSGIRYLLGNDTPHALLMVASFSDLDKVTSLFHRLRIEGRVFDEVPAMRVDETELVKITDKLVRCAESRMAASRDETIALSALNESTGMPALHSLFNSGIAPVWEMSGPNKNLHLREAHARLIARQDGGNIHRYAVRLTDAGLPVLVRRNERNNTAYIALSTLDFVELTPECLQKANPAPWPVQATPAPALLAGRHTNLLLNQPPGRAGRHGLTSFFG